MPWFYGELMRTFPFPDFMDLEAALTLEQRQIAATVRDWVTKEAQPKIRLAYREEQYPTALIPMMGRLGLFGSTLTGYGLPGMDSVSYGLVMRELERCDSGLRSCASVQGGLVMYPIHAFGSEAQKEQ